MELRTCSYTRPAANIAKELTKGIFPTREKVDDSVVELLSALMDRMKDTSTLKDE